MVIDLINRPNKKFLAIPERKSIYQYFLGYIIQFNALIIAYMDIDIIIYKILLY